MAYNVYVIELDREVLNSKKFREKNPHMKKRKSCYYVGQTTHDPETRFSQHKAGYKANRFVKKYGLRLVHKKYQKYNPIKKRVEAEAVEKWLTKRLRKKGYGVWSN